MINREHDVTYTCDSGPAQSFVYHSGNVGQGHSRLGRCCFFRGHFSLRLLGIVLFLTQVGFKGSAGRGVLFVGGLDFCGFLHLSFSFDIDYMSSLAVEHHGPAFICTFLGDPLPLLLSRVRFRVGFLVLLNSFFIPLLRAILQGLATGGLAIEAIVVRSKPVWSRFVSILLQTVEERASPFLGW